MTTTSPVRATETATVASRIQHRARTTPDVVALRQKSLGIWQEITWSDYWHRIEAVAYALMALGVERGDRVAIHSENRPEWLVTDAACSAVRAVCVGLYPTN
ncbi:MAG: AMP-binding protein, partial [Acidimicrobiia bacterium]